MPSGSSGSEAAPQTLPARASSSDPASPGAGPTTMSGRNGNEKLAAPANEIRKVDRSGHDVLDSERQVLHDPAVEKWLDLLGRPRQGQLSWSAPGPSRCRDSCPAGQKPPTPAPSPASTPCSEPSSATRSTRAAGLIGLRHQSLRTANATAMAIGTSRYLAGRTRDGRRLPTPNSSTAGPDQGVRGGARWIRTTDLSIISAAL
jgi:hypothetical protein